MGKVMNFYKSILDKEHRNAEKTDPIMKYIKAYDNAESVQELIDADIMVYKKQGICSF